MKIEKVQETYLISKQYCTRDGKQNRLSIVCELIKDASCVGGKSVNIKTWNCGKEFVFQESEPEKAIAIGELIAEAGKLASQSDPWEPEGKE